MEANSRSPIYSGFGEMLDGLVTVRAFSAERRFLNDLHVKLDFTTKVCPLGNPISHCLTPLLDVVHVLDDQSVVVAQF